LILYFNSGPKGGNISSDDSDDSDIVESDSSDTEPYYHSDSALPKTPTHQVC